MRAPRRLHTDVRVPGDGFQPHDLGLDLRRRAVLAAMHTHHEPPFRCVQAERRVVEVFDKAKVVVGEAELGGGVARQRAQPARLAT